MYHRYDKALEAYKMGIQIEARPIQRLTRNYRNLEARIDEIRRRGLIKKREQEAMIQMNELKSNKRTMLGHKFDARSRTSVSANVYAGIQSTHGSPSRTTSFGNDRFSIPENNNASSKIAVFQDNPPSHHHSPSSSSITSSSSSSLSTRSLFHKSSSPSTQKFQPSISASSASENRIVAEKFSGAIIPQAEIVRPVVESFTVYKDSEEEEIPRRRLERNNSSMLSEASGEESLASKFRRYPTQDIEGFTRSRSDIKSETERDHAKKMEDHFKKNRRFYLRIKDSQEREEVCTVLKTTHVSTSFEEERAITMRIPFTVRDEDEESTGTLLQKKIYKNIIIYGSYFRI